MRRAALLLLIVLAGCGGERPVQRAEGPSRAEMEAFGHFRFPASARSIEGRMPSALDTALFVSFEIDRADLDSFVASTGLRVVPGYRPSYDYAEEGWFLDRLRETLGGRDKGRELVIGLDQPRVATVFLSASET